MKKRYDLILIGWIFLSNVLMDGYLIIAYPHYALKLFGMTFGGVAGWSAKIQSPILHGLIGYGFIKQKRWSYLLYMAYALFGLTNAFVNFYLLGYGRIRMIFVLTLMVVTIYLYLRRRAFNG